MAIADFIWKGLWVIDEDLIDRVGAPCSVTLVLMSDVEIFPTFQAKADAALKFTLILIEPLRTEPSR
jgi:hypothetical protein